MKHSIDPWYDHVAARESEGTAKVYKSHMLSFLIWLEDRPLNQVNIEDFVTHCVKQKYAKITINGKIAAIKAFCSWYCPRHERENPAQKITAFGRADTRPSKQRFLTESEYRKVLIVAGDGIELDTVEFIANTGLRRSEFVTFHPSAVNRTGTHFSIVGKGNKKRKVPMNAKVKDIIDRSRHEDGSLRCVTYWKGNSKYIWNMCQSLARRASIPAFGPHALRHYFATTLIKKGVPIKLVSQVLGHCSVLITEQTYCHLMPEDTTGVTDCLCT